MTEAVTTESVDNFTPTEAPAMKQPEYSEEEQAAARFLYLLPYIKKLGNAMGQKSAVRVLHALAEFPLGEGKPKLLNASEKQLFDIFQELMASKSIIIKNTLAQQAKEKESKNV
jgi:hypothetical protein